MLSTQKCAGQLSLREVLPEAKLLGASDVKFTSCCGKPEDCQPGDIFVALIGSDLDTHDLVEVAIENGAQAVITERYLPVAIPQCLVGDSRLAYGLLCQAIAGLPCESLMTIGVTGSNGKTVTSMLMASVLAKGGRDGVQPSIGVTSSIGHSDGVDQEAARRTTPPQPEIANWLARMVANGCRYAVVEASSKGIADRRLAGMEFDAVLLTNFRRDHIHEHQSVSNYKRLKARLFQQLKPEGFAILNADDPSTAAFLDRITHPVLTYGMHNSAEVMGSVLERHPTEQTFLLSAGSDSVPVRTRMIGDHHVYNCLAAAATALVFGYDLTTIASGLEMVERVPGRLEWIDCGQPFSVYVDGARTPDSISAALEGRAPSNAWSSHQHPGAEAGTDRIQRAELGSAIERGSHVVVLTNDNPGEEKPLSIIHDLLDGFDKPGKPQIAPDRANAINWAIQSARPGDAVVVLGKGDRDEQIIGRKRLAWSDQDLVRKMLFQMGKQASDFPRAESAATDGRPSHRFRIVG